MLVSVPRRRPISAREASESTRCVSSSPAKCSELTGLPPQVFPRFPTVVELAASAPPGQSAKPTGLFEELLQSRAEVIYQDLRQHPDKYELGVEELRAAESERKQAFDEVNRRDYQLEILSRTSQHINAILEIPIIMRTVVASAMEVASGTGLVVHRAELRAELESAIRELSGWDAATRAQRGAAGRAAASRFDWTVAAAETRRIVTSP